MAAPVLKIPSSLPISTLRIGRAPRKALWIQRRASSRTIVHKWQQVLSILLLHILGAIQPLSE